MVLERAVSTYENLGMREEALQWVRPSIISTIESQPELEELINDPRYKEKVESFN